MHRSGSSLLTGLLAENGLNPGTKEHLIDASADNPRGYWERKDVVALNEKILTQKLHNSSFPNYRDPSIDAGDLHSEICTLSRKLKNEGVNIIKDPRFCLTLPLWLEHFEDTRIIFLFRDPFEVALSLHKRQRYPIKSALALWEYYNYRAINNIQDTKFISIFFDHLIEQPETQIQRLHAWLDFSEYKSLTANVQFFDKSLVHNRISRTDSSSLSQSQKLLFSHLLNDAYKNVALSSDSMLDTLDFTKEFVRLGYYPNSGRMIDDQAKQAIDLQRSQIDQQRKKLKNQERRLTEAANLAKSRNAELKKQSRKLTNQELRIRKKESLISNRDERIKSLIEEKQEVASIARIEKTKLQSTISQLHERHNKLTSSRAYRVVRFSKRVIDNRFVRAPKTLFTVLKTLLPRIKQRAIAFRRTANNESLKTAIHKALNEFNRASKGLGIGGDHALAKVYISELSKYDNYFDTQTSVLTKNQFDWVKLIYFPDFYRSELTRNLESNSDNSVNSLSQELKKINGMSDEELFEHLIIVGLEAGYIPGPLFDEEHVNKVFSGNPVTNQRGFLTWLKTGLADDIVPTPLFSPAYYLDRNPRLIGRSDLFLFQHFLREGLYREASPNLLYEPIWYRNRHHLAPEIRPSFYHYLMYGSADGLRPSALFPSFSREFSANLNVSTLQYVLEHGSINRIEERLNYDSRYTELIEKVAKQEPAIHSPKGYKRINVPPFNSPIFPAISEVRKSLNHKQYDSVVLIPHCRVGGAALVSGILCSTVVKILPSQKLLLVRTDNDDFMRPDWFPDNIEMVNLLDYCPDLPDVFRKKVLLDLLVGVKPSRIVNVHSRLAWIVFQEYGDRLSAWSSLYGYSFCYDVDALGRKVGYPVKYVPDSFPFLKKLFVDNHFLRDDLISANGWSGKDASKVEVLMTPVLSALENKPVRTWIAPLPNNQQRAQVFWAGRFDRQKRFDIVVDLAKSMPDVDFQVWGEAMLGDKLDESALPENIKLHGLFNSLDDLPLHQCNCWLYTSQWDGIPTILIELGLRKVPVVASAIWGTKDLIIEETSWPVAKVLNVKDYQEGIKFFLDNSEEAEKRGQALQERVHRNHNAENYSQILLCELQDDRWESC